MATMSQSPYPPPLIIAGPTASGKSELAVCLAERLNGVILNADSRQLYGCLPLLAALPDVTMKQRAPHALYGILAPDQISSVALWHQALMQELQSVRQRGMVPILVGGTGFYIHTFLYGLQSMPEISLATKAHIQDMRVQNHDMWDWLHRLDPERAREIPPRDVYRLERSLEVILETGHSIRLWKNTLSIPTPAFIIALLPPRALLRECIQDRLNGMFRQGVLEEVRMLAQQNLSNNSPVLSTLGVKPFLKLSRQEISAKEALQKVFEETCQYAKRQNTWFTNKLQNTISIPNRMSTIKHEKNVVFFLNAYHSFCESIKGS